MAITPQPGWMIDPNNPNGVVQIGAINPATGVAYGNVPTATPQGTLVQSPSGGATSTPTVVPTNNGGQQSTVPPNPNSVGPGNLPATTPAAPVTPTPTSATTSVNLTPVGGNGSSVAPQAIPKSQFQGYNLPSSGNFIYNGNLYQVNGGYVLPDPNTQLLDPKFGIPQLSSFAINSAPTTTTPTTTTTPVATPLQTPTTPAPVVTPVATPAATSTTTTPTTVAPPAITANLGPNSTGTQVAALQDYLLKLGYSIPSLQNGAAKPGFYGTETQAAVAQWQKDLVAKGELKIPNASDFGYFGPLSRAALTATPAPGTTGPAKDNGTSTTTSKSGLGSEIDQTIAALRTAYGLSAPDPTKSTVQQAIEDYQAVYKALGIPDIKQSYTDAVNEYSKISDELNKKIADIRDDPWLSQGIADRKVETLQTAYTAKLNTATAKMQLFDSLTKEGIAQANDIITQVHQVQSDNASLVNSAIDIVQKKEDALSKLDTQVVEVGGRKQLINSNTGAVIKDLGSAPAASSGGGGTATERATHVVSQFQSKFVPGATIEGTANGTPILDGNGFVTPAAWQAAINDAPSNGLSRSDFIAQFGHYLYIDTKTNKPSASYGLTPAEIKALGY